MRNVSRKVLVFLLLIGLTQTAKPITTTARNLGTAGISAASALTCGLLMHFYLKSLKGTSGEKILKENPWLEKYGPWGAAFIGGAAGGGLAWWKLSECVPAGLLKRSKDNFRYLKNDDFIDTPEWLEEEVDRLLGQDGDLESADIDAFISNGTKVTQEMHMHARKDLKNRRAELKSILYQIEKAEEDGGCDGLDEFRDMITQKRNLLSNIEAYINRNPRYQQNLRRDDEKRHHRRAEAEKNGNTDRGFVGAVQDDPAALQAAAGNLVMNRGNGNGNGRGQVVINQH